MTFAERFDSFSDSGPTKRSPVPDLRDEADTAEMVAADDPDTEEMVAAFEAELEALEESGDTEVTGAPAALRPKIPRRVVEIVRKAERPVSPPPPAARMPSPSPRPALSFDLADDPPTVGVDPAEYPIHKTAPAGIDLRWALLVPVAIVLFAGGALIVSPDADERKERAAAEEQAELRRLAQERVRVATERMERRRQAARKKRRAPDVPKTRASSIHAAARPVQRRKPYLAAVTPANVPEVPPALSRRYGERAEHVPPAESAVRFMSVDSSPKAMVFEGDKLLGATPLLLTLSGEPKSRTVTLRAFGKVEKTVQLRPDEGGHLRATVALEADPRFQAMVFVKGPEPARPRRN